MFRFADTDTKLTTKALKPHEEELTRVLKDTMPGLVQGSAENTAQTALSTVGTDDRLGAGQHHRLLIKPDAFHVSVLFQPTLAFLDRVVEVLPSGLESARASGMVLDEFVLKVYLPQLEERVSTLFLNAVTGMHFFALHYIQSQCAGTDAFLSDPLSRRLSPQPLTKVRATFLFSYTCLRLSVKHPAHGIDQLPPRHAADYAIPSRKLFEAHSRRDHSVLPALQ